MAVNKLAYPAKENAVQEKINEIIDNLGGGGGTVTDVQVDGISVVSDGVANVVLTGKQDVLSTSDTVIVADNVLNTNNIVWRKW